ncbi:MAG: hypothetical protein V4736_07280 [Bdellovibrionota bacterium]
MLARRKVTFFYLILGLLVLYSPIGLAQTPASLYFIFPATTPNPNGEITIARKRAYDIFVGVTGTKVSIDDNRVVQMETLVAAGNEKKAVALATSDRAFYNVRLVNMAKKMSTREESAQVPLNDFVATFVGAVRDGVDARQLLTGNFFYRGDPEKMIAAGLTKFPDISDGAIRISNAHYSQLEVRYSLYDVLVREDGQRVGGEGGINPDAAGLITTRAFMQAHADAGTNRRLVEYTFREFLCTPIQEWKDATRPDNMIGRDVDRFAGGGNTRYQTTCKACHGQMDGLRQAFAYVDFPNNSIGVSAGVPLKKFSSNAQIFPQGFVTKDNKWVNYVTGPLNKDRFGWRGPLTGAGINEFGQMIANSKGFSRCMTKRLFTEICKREPSVNEEPVVRSIASDFEATYKIKDLAEIIAIHPSCIPRRN